MQAVVIGCGIVGAGVTYELVKRGVKVTCVDRLPGPGRGATARSSSVVRCHYGWMEAVKLAAEGRAIWQAWRRYTGLTQPRARFENVGVLFLFGKDAPSGSLGVKAEGDVRELSNMVRAMTKLGVGCELLKPRELRARFFFANFDDAPLGLFEPESGYVDDPRGAVQDLVDAAYRRGARFIFGKAVTAVDRGVRLGSRRLGADVVVNCAGPYGARVNLMARTPLALTTQPQRQYIIEARYEGPVLPCTADVALGYYLRPDARVFKVGAIAQADHRDFLEHPDMPSSAADARRFLESKLALARRRFPALALTAARVRPAVYDWTVKDSYPIFDLTDTRGYYVAVGTSGAWFKGGPAIGHAMAELIVRGRKRVKLPRTGLTLDLAAFSERR